MKQTNNCRFTLDELRQVIREEIALAAQRHENQYRAESVAQSIAYCRNKYPDFDRMRPWMEEILRERPELDRSLDYHHTIETVYQLACDKKCKEEIEEREKVGHEIRR